MTVRQAIRASLALLNGRDRRLLGISIAIQMATSMLDLAGVLLLGLVGALAVTVVQSEPVPATVAGVADFIGLGDLDGQELMVVLAACAAAVLLTKSVASSYLTRRVFVFLANRAALVSARLTRALLSLPLTFLQRRSSQETAFALIQGTAAATISVLGQLSIAVSEATLLVVLSVALFMLDPLVTLAAIAFFALVALGLQKAMGQWASRLGRRGAMADIASLDAVQEALASYREITVADRRAEYVKRIQEQRWIAAKVSADVTFLGLVPKYAFEAALVVGGLALAAALFATKGAVEAVGTLALFLAAASRVMPSLMRLQGAALTLRSASGNAGPTFSLAADLATLAEGVATGHADSKSPKMGLGPYSDFEASILLERASFRYPGEEILALKEISLRVDPGQSLAIVGPSGAGKSTLADLVLGILDPTSGIVRVSGLPPGQAIREWPGAVAYVPQDVMIANGTVRDNVALGLPRASMDDSRIWSALEQARLSDFLTRQRDGLDTNVGESGLKLSGGQRQRLGVARALYSSPQLLVLDEATSALDAETESEIAGMLQAMEGSVTTVVVAHRLSTVKNAELVAYVDSGRLLHLGDFESVRAAVPAFAKQAGLLGV